jgi:hypothetical protein
MYDSPRKLNRQLPEDEVRTGQTERDSDFRSAVISFVTDAGCAALGHRSPFIRTQNFLGAKGTR